MEIIAIFCHDPGGAELISSWTNQNKKNYQFLFFLKGPAIKIFKKKIKNLSICTNLRKALSANIFLCGSGWQTTFELDGLILGKKYKKKLSFFWIIGKITEGDLKKKSIFYMIYFGYPINMQKKELSLNSKILRL